MEIHTLVLNINRDQLLPFIFLYIGPETILPLTSALAAVIGVLLIVWRQALAFVRKIWRILLRK